MSRQAGKWFLTAGLVWAGCAAQAQTEISKADNTDNLNLVGSWVGGSAPTAGEVAKWDATVTGANSVLLGADLSYLGIKIVNPGGTVTIGGANTLSTGTLGIDMSAATANLILNTANLTLLDDASQVWDVAGGRTLTVNAAGTGAGTITKSGLGTLSLNNAMTNAISGDISIGAGTLHHAGNNQIADSATVTMTTIESKWNQNGKSETIANMDVQNAAGYNAGYVTGTAGKLTVTDTLSLSLGYLTLNSSGTGSESIITANTLVNRGGSWVFGVGSGTQSLRIGPGGLTIGGGSTITVDASTGCQNFISLGGDVTSEAYATRANTISGDGELRLNGARNFDVPDGAAPVDLSVSAVIADGTDTGTITKSGLGTLELAGTNTFTGGITVNAGTLVLSGLNTFTGGISVIEGTLSLRSLLSLPDWDTSGLYTIASNATRAAYNGLADGDVATLFGSTHFAGGGYCGFDTTLGNRTYVDALVDPLGSMLRLAKVGANTLTLSGANTFTGGTTVKAGTLNLSGENPFTGGITVDGGTLTLNKSATNAVTGDISIGAGTLTHGQNEQIADTATVTMTTATSQWLLKAKNETIANLDIQNAGSIYPNGFVSADYGYSSTLTVTNTLTHTLGNIALASSGTGGESILTANTLVNRGGSWTFGQGSGTQSLMIGPGGLTIGGGSTISVGASTTCKNFISLGGDVTSETDATVNTISGAGELRLNGTRNFIVPDGAAPVDLSVSAVIADGTGTGTITKSGPGTLDLSGANTFTGGISVNEGTLALSSLLSVPGWDTSGLYAIASNATLAAGNSLADGDVATLLGTWNFADGATFGFDTALGDRTYTAALTDPSGIKLRLAKVGANTLTLSGENTYSGVTVVKSGMLSIPATGALPGWNTAGSYEVWRDAALIVGNAINDADIAAMLGTGNFLDGACIGFDTVSGNRTYSPSIGNTANGALGVYKVGTNTLTLTGDNSYNGNTFVMRGTLIVNHDHALGTASGNTVIYATGSTATGGRLTLGTGVTLAEPITLYGPGEIASADPAIDVAGAGTHTLDGAITLAGQGVKYRIIAATGDLTFNGPIGRASGVTASRLVFSANAGRSLIISNTVDFGTLYCSVLGAGIVSVCSTGNDWAYISILQGGTARLGVDNALPTDKKVIIGGGDSTTGCFDLGGFNQTVGGLGESGTAEKFPNNLITNSVPASFSTLTIEQASGVSDTFGGRILGAVHLVKAGAANSTLTLREVNGFSGTTTVTGGTLALDATGSLGEACVNVVVAAGLLKVQNSSAIADRAVLGVASGGGAKVELAAGVNETVRYLVVDSDVRRVGTYGSTSSAATYKDDDLFSGTGVLTVSKDDSGMLIKVR